MPNPPLKAVLFFSWCGLDAEWTTKQGGTQSWYDEELIDVFVCDTSGRYGENTQSATYAEIKQLSVSPQPATGSNCGFRQVFLVSCVVSGSGYLIQEGIKYRQEYITTGLLFTATVFQCFDGREADISISLTDETGDNSCGAGIFNPPCDATPPEITVVLAP